MDLPAGGGTPFETRLEAQRFGGGPFLLHFLVPFLVGLVHLLLGVLVFRQRPGLPAARAFYVFCLFVALFGMLKFAANLDPVLFRVWLAYPIFGAAALELILSLPPAGPPSRLLLGVVRGADAAVVGLVGVRQGLLRPDLFLWASRLTLFTLGGVFLLSLALLVAKTLRSPPGTERDRGKVILTGFLLGYLPAGVWALTAGGGWALYPLDAAVVFFVLLPASVAVAIVRHRLFDVDRVLRHGASYALATGGVTVVYLGGASLLSLLIQRGEPGGRGWPTLLAVVLVGALFEPVRRRAQSGVDRLYYRARYRDRMALRELIESVAHPLEVGPLAERLTRRAASSFATTAWLFLRDEGGRLDLVRSTRSDEPRFLLRESDPLLVPLARWGEAMDLEELRRSGVARDAQGERSSPAFDRMVRSGGALWIPLEAGAELVGLLVLGAPAGGGIYRSEDRALLTALAHRAGGALRAAAEADRLRRERSLLEERTQDLEAELARTRGSDRIVAASPAFRSVLELAHRVAPSAATVLLVGESGTGKELVAQEVHERSPRREGPLIKVNCAAIPETLLESELFGHERGAFTGAVAQRKGKFELADGGTLFLDEIAELTPPLQAKLLRVLQEREFDRVGGTAPVRVDVRVVAATNQDPEEAVRRRTFRGDLLWRLKVVRIDLPPLRDRREDVLPLAEHFLKIYARGARRRFEGFSPDARRGLLAYPWPGNVRELENLVQRATVLAAGPSILLEDLPEEIRAARGRPVAGDRPLGTGHLRGLVEDYEKGLLVAALQKTRGSQAGAAKLLGISRGSLRYKLRTYKLED